MRKRYLAQLLKRYSSAKAELDNLARKTNGCTQAFIKELTYRAVQTCYIRSKDGARQEMGPETLELTEQDFGVAMMEMRSGAGRAGEAIIGFRGQDGRFRTDKTSAESA